MPNDYKAMLNLIVQMEERGLSSEQAKMEAFNIKANAGKQEEIMGKPTGFLDYEREDARAESPKERIKHF